VKRDLTGSSSLFRFEETVMPMIDLRQARTEVRLAEVLELLGWTARARRGVQVRGGCPLHGSRSPTSRSFSAHLGRNIWQCFRCGASGNALDLWVAVTRQPLYPAVLELYRRLGRVVPWLPAANPKG
jgi:DNA primase